MGPSRLRVVVTSEANRELLAVIKKGLETEDVIEATSEYRVNLRERIASGGALHLGDSLR